VKTTKTTTTGKRIGLVAASPAEFLVHQRLGKTLFAGRGRAAFILPGIDRAYLIPSALQSVAFQADQITAENQGVEIVGFAIYSIARPEKAIEAIDFTNPDLALETIASHLRQVVESAIRSELANLSLDDALRKRGAIIERMRAELADVADRLGLDIATVEIKTVTIMSDELFLNMQAPYRNNIRLQSERSRLGTDEIIAKENAAMRELDAKRQAEFQAAETARQTELTKNKVGQEAEIERLRAESQTETELAKLNATVTLREGEVERQRRIARADAEILEIEKNREAARFANERQRHHNAAEAAQIADATERRAIETANTANPLRLIAANLPKITENLKFGQINLGDPVLARLLEGLAERIGKPNQGESK
jgi:regulator of protease activity HflC (stomatin/prohibitin superfamily)